MTSRIYALTAVVMMGIGCAINPAYASVQLDRTRVIYHANEREMTVQVLNDGTAPVLIQAWMDKGEINAAPATIEVPFVLTPVTFRLNPGKGQALRMVYTKEPLPKDKESLFWLDVQEVPPKSKPTTGEQTNVLEFSFRTRIKVLFRPQGLPGDANKAPEQVTWTLVRDADGKGYAIQGSNPTPYYVNLGEVSLVDGGKTYSATQGYIEPRSSQRFPIEGLAGTPSAGAEVEYVTIDDLGTYVQAKHALSAASAMH